MSTFEKLFQEEQKRLEEAKKNNFNWITPSKVCCWECESNRPPEERWFGMIVCQVCGNKRCPKANDHTNECTNSNEPGQPGSAYEDV